MVAPKLNTAAQLAKQAAQMALAESGGAPAPAAKPSGWVVPRLGTFRLDDALGNAYDVATGYLNYMLAPEGLVVDVQQATGQTQAQVLEKDTSRVYRTYAGEDMLRLYAAQRGGRGVVADGQV
jgi:hypothetical protein